MNKLLTISLIGGLVLCIFHFIRFTMNAMWVLGDNPLLSYGINLLILISFMILAGIKLQAKSNRQRNFGNIFRTVFLAMSIMVVTKGIYELTFVVLAGKKCYMDNKELVINNMIDDPISELRMIINGVDKQTRHNFTQYLLLDEKVRAEKEKDFQAYYDNLTVWGFFEIPLSILFGVPLSLLIALLVKQVSRKSVV